MSVESVMLSNHLILWCPFSFCLQSFLAAGSFPVSQLVTSGGQSISASASVLPMNIQDWFPLGLNWFDLEVQGTLESLSQHHSSKALILRCSAFFMVQLSYQYMLWHMLAASLTDKETEAQRDKDIADTDLESSFWLQLPTWQLCILLKSLGSWSHMSPMPGGIRPVLSMQWAAHSSAHPQTHTHTTSKKDHIQVLKNTTGLPLSLVNILFSLGPHFWRLLKELF